jgi:hypothetical protein
MTTPRTPHLLLLAALCFTSAGAFDVLTYHNDLSRSGLNASESALTLQNVNSAQFGKLFQFAVDGYVYAQPLYVTNVQIANLGARNVVYVATQHDSVYAFDANSNLGSNAQPLWHVSFVNANGATTVPSGDVYTAPSPDIVPEIGITGTPVIDRASQTLYVVAFTKENGAYVQRLHALDITNGAERTGSPVAIVASIPGTASDSINGHLAFNAKTQLQRCALMLYNNTIYIEWASFGDAPPYHGWVISYDAATLAQKAVYCDTPDGNEGGIWMGGSAPSVDTSGNIYLVTGNGDFSAASGGRNYGDSVLRLNPDTLALADYFTPHDQATLAANDLDLGSSGALLLPDQPGAHPHLLLMGGKLGTLYLLDRDNLGKFHATSDAIVQTLPSATNGLYGMPAYFNGNLYVFGQSGFPLCFKMQNGLVVTTPTSQANTSYPRLGATPSISANGTQNGIVWSIERSGTGVLHAYNAGNLSNELYNSNQVASRDGAGLGVKFSAPTIADGKVLIGTQNSVIVYGTLATKLFAPPVIDSLPVSSPAAVTWPVVSSTLSVVAHDINVSAQPLTYTWSQLSGPGQITFSSTANSSITATFPFNGDYQISVSVSNSAYTTSASVLVTVTGNPNVPPSNGGNPGGTPNDPGTGTQDPPDPQPLAIQTHGLRIALNFAHPLRDSITMSGVLALTQIPGGKSVALTIGGVTQNFDVDSTGKSAVSSDLGRYTLRFWVVKSHKQSLLKVQARFANGNFAQALAAQGLVNSTLSKVTSSVPVDLVIDAAPYHAEVQLVYTSQAQRGGRAH